MINFLIIIQLNCQNPNSTWHNLKLGLTWKWLCTPPATTPTTHRKLNISNISVVIDLILTKLWISWSKIIFIQRFLCTKNYFGKKKFDIRILNQKNFVPKICFWTKIFLSKIYFWPKMFLEQKWFLDQSISMMKYSTYLSTS